MMIVLVRCNANTANPSQCCGIEFFPFFAIAFWIPIVFLFIGLIVKWQKGQLN